MTTRRVEIKYGDRYGNLLILEEIAPIYWRKYAKRMVRCKCDCGNIITVRLEYLRSQHTTSCGCERAKFNISRSTHRREPRRLYDIWANMLARCRNPKVKSFKDYGAKGVTVCRDWYSFESFRDWSLTHGYSNPLTIDRENPCGNYEPSNCRWIQKAQQSENRRPRAN